VLFQRVKDVLYKVADGTAQLGITGMDVVHEYRHENLIVIHPKLGYGHCSLMIAVPETWIDVDSMLDLVDVALDFREQRKRNIRIATTYPTLTRRFLHAQGLHHFTLVRAEGAIEAAPTIGYADIICDLTQTGTTLRENNLKPIPDGVVIESQACLIGNLSALRQSTGLLQTTRTLVEYIDSALQGKKYNQVTVNIAGRDPQEIAQKVAANPITRGLQGPTIAPIYASNSGDADGQWYTVTLIIENSHVLPAVEHLRSIGGTQSTVIPAKYVFLPESPTYRDLTARLG
jgi:ATP phosphoribosyltransferase